MHINGIRSLLWLASFTQHNLFKVHLCCSIYQYFISFSGQITVHYMDTDTLFNPLTDGHLGVSIFQLLGLILGTFAYKFLHRHMFLILSGVLLGHIVTILLYILWGTTKLFSKVAVSFIFPPAMHEGSLHPWDSPCILSVTPLFNIVIWVILAARSALTVIGSKRRFVF